MLPYEGHIWRNKRNGRTCEVKMVRLGRIVYRYVVPERVGGKTKPNVISQEQFVGSFYFAGRGKTR